uniref:Cordon-bleu ubiquitin-like domain-containing protein n=1 Tax=Pundamilia nyererei TaxID=303518 RepID=A0A3B4F0F1_9CICH
MNNEAILKIIYCFLSNFRVSTKSKAPSPPGLKRLESPGFSQRYPGNPYLKMDQKENLIDKELSLTVVLPGGVETTAIVHGSEPLMDLLVTLCAKYRLNPSSHTLELITSNKNNIKLKPSALIGTLDAEKIILKPKGEDKNKKTGPQMPEATVRMVINYKKTQKTILRVNPRVPLAELLPAICEKCEFDVETTILLKDVQSRTPLNLSNSLNDYAIREVYARDTQGECYYSKRFLIIAPASPVLVSKPRPLSMALPSSNSSPLGSPTISTDAPKKRRAPQPPILVSQSCTSDPRTRQRLYSEPNVRLHGDQVRPLLTWCLPVPPPNNADEDSSPAIAPVCESPGKKDMATLTEDLGPPELEQALPPTSETSLCQDSTPSAPVTAKVPPMYATDSEPKPKPSNELTRDYIPKVGMTTYTIVPPKSQEKLRYFEVALTLETPTEASQQVLNTDSAHSDESTRQMEQEVSKEKSELHSTLHREDGLPNTATNQHTVNGGIPESTQLSSPTSLCNTDKVSSSVGASPAGSPAEVKEMKIPPATKPKPASFRLSQHKKTPGYYVTSAAEKSLERANLPPPPLPPPAQCDEETTGAANIQLSPKQVNRNVPLMRMTRQSSLPVREPSTGLSLEKFRSFAAPRPYSPAIPSRFAQAVSSAVKRSHSVTYRPKPPLSPVLPPVSPTPSLSSVTESKQLSKLKVSVHSASH